MLHKMYLVSPEHFQKSKLTTKTAAAFKGAKPKSPLPPSKKQNENEREKAKKSPHNILMISGLRSEKTGR